MPTHLQVQANSMDMPSSWQPVCRCLLRRLLTGEKKFNEQSFELQTTIAKALCASGGTRHPPGHTWLKGVLCLTMQRAQFEQHSLLAGFPGGLCAPGRPKQSLCCTASWAQLRKGHAECSQVRKDTARQGTYAECSQVCCLHFVHDSVIQSSTTSNPASCYVRGCVVLAPVSWRKAGIAFESGSLGSRATARMCGLTRGRRGVSKGGRRRETQGLYCVEAAQGKGICCRKPPAGLRRLNSRVSICEASSEQHARARTNTHAHTGAGWLHASPRSRTWRCWWRLRHQQELKWAKPMSQQQEKA
eukprot:1158538-Pelagomonas_calceolata.AAC.4